MTALVFTILPDQICLAMDTLVVSGGDKTPLCYQTKYSVLPHMNLVIAGTGLAALVAGWFNFVNGNMIAQDIDHLNQYVRASLRNIASHFENKITTTTLYHFGYSKFDKRYVGYAYRSTNDWVPEKLTDGLGIKPVIGIASTDDIQCPQFFIDIVSEQRRQDLLLPLLERVGIGGDIHFLEMKDLMITVSTVHRFDSYESDYKLMADKIDV